MIRCWYPHCIEDQNAMHKAQNKPTANQMR